MDRGGGALVREPELRRERADRVACGGDVEAYLAAEKERRVEVAEEEIRVGDGRVSPAVPVAGRPGARARRIGSDAQQTRRVDTRDAPAARADLDELHARGEKRQPGAAPQAMRPRDLE